MQAAKNRSTWKESALTGFEAHISLSKATATAKAYIYDIEKFLDYLTGLNVKRLSSLKREHIIRYLSHCKSELSDATVCRYYMSLKSFSQYLRRVKLIQCDLLEDIPAPLVRSKAPRIPSIEEVHKLLSAPDATTEYGARDRAILELLYSSGLRASELCDLLLDDVSAGAVRVSCGKRGKTRTVPLTHTAWATIAQYIDGYRGTDPGPLFVTSHGKRLSRQFLYKLVSKYAEQCGIADFSTHTLRHACATHLLDHGADIRLIQAVLGHSSIASTQRYTHLSSASMQQMFGQYHPRDKNGIF